MITKNKDEFSKLLYDEERASILIEKTNNIIFEVLEDGSMIIFDEITQDTHLLNSVAGLIFKLCNGRRAGEIYSDFIGQISSDAEVSKEEIEADFYETIDQLANKNVIKMS